MNKKIYLFLFSFLLISSALIVNAAALNITLSVNHSAYNRNETVNISGTLKQDSAPVTDGLVGIQVNSNGDNTLVLRTVNTGSNPSYQPVPTITNVFSCDISGNPVSDFSKSTIASYKVTVYNYDTIDRYVLVSVNVYDNNNKPLYVLTGELTIIGRTASSIILGSGIPTWAASGRATVFANLYTGLPKNGGVPYSAESSSIFTIGGVQGNAPPAMGNGNNGNYMLSFKLPPTATVGTSTVYARSTYNGLTSTLASTFFQVNQLGDFTGDGIVNFNDIIMFVDSYIHYNSGQAWIPATDFSNDNKVDFNDIIAFVDAYIAYHDVWG
jgi:hypothetical protein